MEVVKFSTGKKLKRGRIKIIEGEKIREGGNVMEMQAVKLCNGKDRNGKM